MYTLIGSPKNRAFRVVWMLEELGLSYDIKSVGPQSEELRAVNPAGKSPVLKDDDEIVIDSAAIIQYLADKHGKFTHKAGTIERAKQDSFLHFAIDDLDGILWTAAKHSFIFPEELRAEGVRAACAEDLKKSYQVLETRLGDQAYVMGDALTVPDIIIGHCAGWAENAKFGWPEGKLGDYVTRLRARPAFQKAHAIRAAA